MELPKRTGMALCHLFDMDLFAASDAITPRTNALKTSEI
jgi:hypothetical protein